MKPLAHKLMLGAAALLFSVGAAQAHVSVGVGVNFGFPYPYAYPYAYGTVTPVLPYGAVAYGHGAGRHWSHGGAWFRPWGPRFVMVAPPVGYVLPAEPVPALPQVPVAPDRPDPVIYPRNGQNAQQTEYDRQECNRWATTQQAAMADAGVFQRAVEACLDGRGYTTK
jgi:hypothetical protein